MPDLCKHCGKVESEHCVFEAQVRPVGCVCDWGTWGDSINPICTEYDGNDDSYCSRCEHDKACHAPKD